MLHQELCSSPLTPLPKKEHGCQFTAHVADAGQDKKALGVESPRSRITTAGNSPATSIGSGDDGWDGLTAASPVYLKRLSGSPEHDHGDWGSLQTVLGLPDIPCLSPCITGNAKESVSTPQVLDGRVVDTTPSSLSTSVGSSPPSVGLGDSFEPPRMGSPMYLKRVNASPEKEQEEQVNASPEKVQISIEDTILAHETSRRSAFDVGFKNPAGVIGERVNACPELKPTVPIEQQSGTEGGEILWTSIEKLLFAKKPLMQESSQSVALGGSPFRQTPTTYPPQAPVLRLAEAIPTTGAALNTTPVSSMGVSSQPQVLSTILGCESGLAPSPHSSVLRLADAIEEPTMGSFEMPTAGSSGHRFGNCKPCAFMHTKGCSNGFECSFCHICGPDELRRRKKERVTLRQNVLRLTKAMP